MLYYHTCMYVYSIHFYRHAAATSLDQKQATRTHLTLKTAAVRHLEERINTQQLYIIVDYIALDISMEKAYRNKAR